MAVALNTGLAIQVSGQVSNIVSNPDFEEPVINDTYVTVFAGQSFGGWSVDTQSVDILSSRHWIVGSGSQCVDLAGTPGEGLIHQDLATEPGMAYDLNFLFASNPDGEQGVKLMRVWWNGSIVATNSFNTAGHTVNNMGWTNISMQALLATGTTTRLAFEGLDPGNWGCAIDLVRVTRTPATPIEYKITSIKSSGNDVVLTAQTAPHSTNNFQAKFNITNQFQNISDIMIAPDATSEVEIIYTNTAALTNPMMFFRLSVTNLSAP